jgi:hypothetical protein
MANKLLSWNQNKCAISCVFMSDMRLTPANARAMLTVHRTARVEEIRNDLARAAAVGLAAINT